MKGMKRGHLTVERAVFDVWNLPRAARLSDPPVWFAADERRTVIAAGRAAKGADRGFA